MVFFFNALLNSDKEPLKVSKPINTYQVILCTGRYSTTVKKIIICFEKKKKYKRNSCLGSQVYNFLSHLLIYMYVYIPVWSLNSHFLPCGFQNSKVMKFDRKCFYPVGHFIHQPQWFSKINWWKHVTKKLEKYSYIFWIFCSWVIIELFP